MKEEGNRKGRNDSKLTGLPSSPISWHSMKWDPLPTPLSIITSLRRRDLGSAPASETETEGQGRGTHVGTTSYTSAVPLSSTPPATLSSTQQSAFPSGLSSGD